MFWKGDRLSAGRDVFFFVWGQTFFASLHLRVIIELSLLFFFFWYRLSNIRLYRNPFRNLADGDNIKVDLKETGCDCLEWFYRTLDKEGSLDSVVGVATRYGLESPGIESRWGEIFRTYPGWLRGPPSLLYNGYRVFPGGKGGRGVMLTTHPLIVPRLRKSWAIPPLTLWVLLGLLRGPLYLYLDKEGSVTGYYEHCKDLLVS